MVNRAGEVAVEEEKKEKSAEGEKDGVSEEERNLNLVHGLEQGWKTAQVRLTLLQLLPSNANRCQASYVHRPN